MLTIELVPSTVFFKNLRSEVSKKEWDIIRREAYREADYKCTVCSGKGPKHPVECHEIWEYNDKKHIQKLLGVTALCPSCHEVKHMGLAQIRGRWEPARDHLAKVNDWTVGEAEKYIAHQFIIWEERSWHQWKLDISWLSPQITIKFKNKEKEDEKTQNRTSP